MSAVETPPPGLGPAVAVSRASAGDRSKTTIGTIVGYVVIFLGFTLVRGFWWPEIPLFAVGAALTIMVVQRKALAAGDGWLKTSGGGWVDTTRLKTVRIRRATTATFVELEDVARRRLDVRIEDLVRTPRLWRTFYAALSRSLDNGLVLDEQTGARMRATDAAIAARG